MIHLHDVKQVHPDVAESITYQLLMERPEEANISHDKLPTLKEHAHYLHHHPHRVWLLIADDDAEYLGAILLTTRNEIGIAILLEHQRKGYARQAIEKVMFQFPPLPAVNSVRTGHYVANINPANQASIALFQKLGFTHIQNTYRAP